MSFSLSISTAVPRLRWLALALAASVVLFGVLFSSSANAAQGSANVCVKKKKPNKGKMRFLGAGKNCKKGEKLVTFATGAPQQGPKGAKGG